jgi:hypothetical protein
MGAWRRGARLVALVIATGCGATPKDAAVRLNPALCAPLRPSLLAGYALRDEAPLLDRRWRYRCVAFEGTEDPTEITVFAEGFRPEVYLIEPGAAAPMVGWSRSGPGPGTARLVKQLKRGGTYLAVVTTVDEAEQGSFLVSIQGMSHN